MDIDNRVDLAALARRALEHDDDAAHDLVRQLYPLVAKLVHSRRPRRMPVEDLCQMIFIKIFRNLSQYSGKVPIEHWVARIAINTCLNQVEAEKARPEVRLADLSEEQASIVEQLADTNADLQPEKRFAARDLVEYLLTRLKPAERLVVDMLYLQQRSVAEIKALTGWSMALVKVRAFRARRKMKDLLNRLEEEGQRAEKL